MRLQQSEVLIRRVMAEMNVTREDAESIVSERLQLGMRLDTDRLLDHGADTGTRFFTGHANVSAQAALSSQIQLFNPVGSGIVVIVPKIRGWATAANRLQVLLNNAQISTVVAGANYLHFYNRDSRFLTDVGSAAGNVATFRINNQSAVVAGAFLDDFSTGGAAFFAERDYELLLMPGWGVGLQPDAQNVAAQGGLDWEEWPLAVR